MIKHSTVGEMHLNTDLRVSCCQQVFRERRTGAIDLRYQWCMASSNQHRTLPPRDCKLNTSCSGLRISTSFLYDWTWKRPVPSLTLGRDVGFQICEECCGAASPLRPRDGVEQMRLMQGSVP